jgi:hypothetical protein
MEGKSGSRVNIRNRKAVLTQYRHSDKMNSIYFGAHKYAMWRAMLLLIEILVHKKPGSRSPGFMGQVSYPAVHEMTITGIEFFCKGDVAYFF